jgi:hypothetical protein
MNVRMDIFMIDVHSKMVLNHRDDSGLGLFWGGLLAISCDVVSLSVDSQFAFFLIDAI